MLDRQPEWSGANRLQRVPFEDVQFPKKIDVEAARLSELAAKKVLEREGYTLYPIVKETSFGRQNSDEQKPQPDVAIEGRSVSRGPSLIFYPVEKKGKRQWYFKNQGQFTWEVVRKGQELNSMVKEQVRGNEDRKTILFHGDSLKLGYTELTFLIQGENLIVGVKNEKIQ